MLDEPFYLPLEAAHHEPLTRLLEEELGMRIPYAHIDETGRIRPAGSARFRLRLDDRPSLPALSPQEPLFPEAAFSVATGLKETLPAHFRLDRAGGDIVLLDTITQGKLSQTAYHLPTPLPLEYRLYESILPDGEFTLYHSFRLPLQNGMLIFATILPPFLEPAVVIPYAAQQGERIFALTRRTHERFSKTFYTPPIQEELQSVVKEIDTCLQLEKPRQEPELSNLIRRVYPSLSFYKTVFPGIPERFFSS